MSAEPLKEPEPPDPRIILAAERTLLAWIRTGLALMGFGFVVARFGIFLREIAGARGVQQPGAASVWAGTALVVCGVAATAAGMWDHFRIIRRIRRREDLSLRHTPGVAIGMTLCAVGVALAIYLVSR